MEMPIDKPMTGRRRRGFSRVDLIVTVALAVCLGAWLTFNNFGERGRIARCAKNLKVLGQAFQADAHDHENELVPAGIKLENIKESWDTELLPYLNPSLAKSTAVDAEARLLSASAPRFHCPSDTFERGPNPRTYAMAARDMMMGWPPGPGDTTGVGLYWEQRTIVADLGQDAWEQAKARPQMLPRLPLSVLTSPAHTLLLSELLMPDNIVGSATSTRIFNARQQIEVARQIAIYAGGPQRFHYGTFNYLMADGHVERLGGAQTGGMNYPPAGIWTIKAGD